MCVCVCVCTRARACVCDELLLPETIDKCPTASTRSDATGPPTDAETPGEYEYRPAAGLGPHALAVVSA